MKTNVLNLKKTSLIVAIFGMVWISLGNTENGFFLPEDGLRSNNVYYLAGDADGSVSVLDFSAWASAFGMTTTYHQADADMDGGITVLDFSKWAANFGMNPGGRWSYRSQVP